MSLVKHRCHGWLGIIRESLAENAVTSAVNSGERKPRRASAFDDASGYDREMQRKSARSLVLLASSGCVALVTFQLLDYDVAAATAETDRFDGFCRHRLSGWCVAFQVRPVNFAGPRVFLVRRHVSCWANPVLLSFRTWRFFPAHVAYIAAFVVNGINARWIAVAALPVAIVGIAVSVWLTPHIPMELIIPVRAYTAVISLMVIAAIGTRGRGATMLVLAGALMFFLSDLSVAALRLVQTALSFVWGLPSYYAGQLCLAASVSQSR